MKRTIVLILVLLLFIFGCTKVPEKVDKSPKQVITDGIKKITDISIIENNKTETVCTPPQKTCLDTQTVTAYQCENNKLKTIQTPCPAAYECRGGTCTEKVQPVVKACEDTDGKNSATPGKTTANGKTYEDSCNAIEMVKEYYCEGGKLQNLLTNCPSGTTCQNGACKEAPSYCKETDDGINSTKYGEVTIEKGNIFELYKDNCINVTTIREYYCEDNRVQNKPIDCDSGASCKNEVCGRIDYCTDTDSGINSIIKGVVTVLERRETEQYSNNFNDQCMNQSTLLEYYCLGNKLAFGEMPCKGGCDNGRCFRE